MIGHLWIWISVQSNLIFWISKTLNRNRKIGELDIGHVFFQIIYWLLDFQFPIFRISETGDIVLYFNNIHLSDSRLFLYHIGKRVSHMVFDWMIVSWFVICLNFLFSTYKYHDRTFMNSEMYGTRERHYHHSQQVNCILFFCT